MCDVAEDLPEKSWVLMLIEAAEAAVYMPDPTMPGKWIVGLRIDPGTHQLAQVLSTFNLLVNLAEIAASTRTDDEQL